MCVSTDTSNKIATQLVSTGSAAGLGALTSTILGHSLGAAGGAAFGASSYIVGKSVQWICTKIFNLDDNNANNDARNVAFIAGFVASIFAGIAAASYFGIELTFTAAVLLNVATFIIPTAIGVGVVCCFACCCGRTSNQKSVDERLAQRMVEQYDSFMQNSAERT